MNLQCCWNCSPWAPPAPACAPFPYRPAPQVLAECKKVADCLHASSALVVRDPRCNTEHNNAFIDMMEEYFAQSEEAKKPDERAEMHYQVGVTPEGVEVPKCVASAECLKEIAAQPEQHRAVFPKGADPKWRFFWKLGERPKETRFAELNAAPVLPKAFPGWKDQMDKWGGLMLGAVEVVSIMAAVGLGLPEDAFVGKMKCAPHLLAPTGSDLSKYHDLNQIFAGYHYDLNFITIHGKSRFPGLYVWLRDGSKVPVKVPDGCLLCQAGKQIEWLTAGYVRAGMHEVICTPKTQEAMEKARAEGRSTWRVSSTVFSHLASDEKMSPMGRYADLPEAKDYPETYVGDYVQQELEDLELKTS